MNFKTTFLALSMFASTSHAITITIAPYNQATDEQAITHLIKLTVDAYIAESSVMQSDVTKPLPEVIFEADQIIDMILETANTPDLYTTLVLKESSSIEGFIVIGHDGAFPDEKEVIANIGNFTVVGNNPHYNEYRSLLLGQAIKHVLLENVVTKIRWIISPESAMSQDFISVLEQHGFKYAKNYHTFAVYELDLGKKIK